MTGRGRRWLVPVLTIGLLFGTIGASASDAPAQVESGRIPGGRTPGHEPVELTVLLKVPGRVKLRAAARAVSDPRSGSFRQFLSPAEIGERFGLPRSEIDAVAASLARVGITVIKEYDQRTVLRARGARAVESLLGVRLFNYRDRHTGLRYHAPDRKPTVPRRLAHLVAGVTGLDTAPTARPLARPSRREPARAGYLRPPQLRSIYGIDRMHEQGFDGSGQTVAIVSFDNAKPSDIDDWDAEMGVTGPPVEDVPVNGGTEPGAATAEVTLDIQMIRALAPQAQILNYETKNGNGFADIVTRIVDDARAKIVSVSWGRCEAHRSPQLREAEETAFTAAAATGVSVLVASGDSGAYGCRGSERPPLVPSAFMSDLRVDTAFPAGSPHVISVGGTSTRVGPGFTYALETAWEDSLSHWATGGGFDEHFARPDWQRGSGVAVAAEGRDRRQVPDVAGPADNYVNLYHSYTNAETGNRMRGTMGGTSAAAPFWAGYLTLVQQQSTTGGTGPLGFVAPMLYELAAANPTGALFHDIVSGGNLLTEATRGWDFATGLGSTRALELSTAIVEYLRTLQAR